jgi:hypothetical protein
VSLRALLIAAAVGAVLLLAVALILPGSTRTAWVSQLWHHSDYTASEDMIQRIEDFRRRQGWLPASLVEIGMRPSEVCPCYRLTSASNYEVWFGTVLGESLIYDSETRAWH